MRNLLATLTVALVSLALLVPEADARRFGGGKSLGRSSPSYSRQATPPPPPQAAPRQATPQAGAPVSNSRRWLGPVAGLVAGGLLGAMLFGDAFQGLQFMDFLLLILLAVGIFMFFRKLRGRRPAVPPHQHYAAAGGPAGRPGFETPEIGSGAVPPPPPPQRPGWFDEQRFLADAKGHFTRLQEVWDRNDLEEIREYVTPELYTELALERQRQDAGQYTEVVSLNSELAGLVREGNLWVATVRFSGLIREARDAAPHAFSDLWIIERAADDPQANWYVSGIQQESLPSA